MENEVIRAIKSRRSIRKYKETQITEEELQTILAAGIDAPSANNCQPWYFTVVQDKELINHMSNKTKEGMLQSDNENIVKMGKSDLNIFYNAPTVIVVSGREDAQSAIVDCSAAIENMLLACESIDLGAVWIGFVRFFFELPEEVKKLNLPEGYKPLYGVAIGYKDTQAVQGEKKRNKDVISYIR